MVGGQTAERRVTRLIEMQTRLILATRAFIIPWQAREGAITRKCCRAGWEAVWVDGGDEDVGEEDSTRAGRPGRRRFYREAEDKAGKVSTTPRWASDK